MTRLMVEYAFQIAERSELRLLGGIESHVTAFSKENRISSSDIVSIFSHLSRSRGDVLQASHSMLQEEHSKRTHPSCKESAQKLGE